MLGPPVSLFRIHQGGAALRVWGRSGLAARAWRLLFAALTFHRSVLVIGYSSPIATTACGSGTCRGSAGLIPLIWSATAISFFFLYPATYNLAESRRCSKPDAAASMSPASSGSAATPRPLPGALVLRPTCSGFRSSFHAGHLCWG